MKRLGLLRADSRKGSGLGHLSRTLSVAHMLKDQFDLVFVTETIPENSIEELRRINVEPFRIIEGPSLEELRILKNKYVRADFIFFDGYNFGVEYQRVARDSGLKVIVVDDYASNECAADLVLNHAPGSSLEMFSVPSATEVCAGLDYALLQPCFLDKAVEQRQNGTDNGPTKLFLCMGGLDPGNITFAVALQLLRNTELRIHCVVGASYRSDRSLYELTSAFPDRLEISKGITHEEISGLMSEATLALTSASTTAIEACASGLPLITGWIVDNQKLIYEGLVALGLALPLGKISSDKLSNLIQTTTKLIQDKSLRKKIIGNQRQAIDGRSGERLAKKVNELFD